MATPEDNRSEFNRNRDEARSQIDSALASSPAFWTITAILVLVVIGSVVMTFI